MIARERISIQPYKNVKATIFSLAVLGLYIVLYVFVFISFSNHKKVIPFNTDSGIQYYFIIVWLFTIGSIVWSYKIAKQQDREPAIWILIGISIGSIGLLILSLKDYDIKDPKIKEIILRTRKEFKARLKTELGQFLDKNLIKEKKIILTKEYQNLLEIRCAAALSNEKIELLKEMINLGLVDQNTDLTDKARIIEKMETYKMTGSDEINWKKEWVENDTICAACGTEIDEKSSYCLNCGLKIK